MEDNVVLVAPDFSSHVLLMAATAPFTPLGSSLLLAASTRPWSLSVVEEKCSAVLVSFCVKAESDLLHWVQPMSRETITLITLALVSKRFYPFEGVLGESLIWSSRIGNIEACGRCFLLRGVALWTLSPFG
ncbi:Os06g0274400 [Oryza sativa Japonica Group]|uniref:Os06g0274400 protein n=1 Tax=Oryza sativa subsp. japonica TaxID=39947 RepID=A0A0N7KLX3_ORYSJ|nr:Os06g0274400 [Oryza sativa Japonica Group]